MIEQIKQTEYNVVLDNCTIKIGGTGEGFIPNVFEAKWNGEAWFNLYSPDPVGIEKPSFDGNIIGLELKDRIHRYYIDQNKLEHEIELFSRPADDLVIFNIDFSEGIRFRKQLTIYEDWLYEQSINPDNPNNLSWEQYQQAVNRPENVVGSYAIYYAKTNNRYKNGKFGHLYFPYFVDRNGERYRVKDFIIENKQATIALPPDAKYPIILDPTLGNSVQGASNWGYNNIKDTIWDVTDGTGGTINTYYCQLESVAENTDVKIGVYNCEQVAYDPDGQALVEQALIVDVEVGENSVAGGSTNLVANTYYNVAWIPESSDTDVYYDSDGNCGYYRTGQVYAEQLDNPWGEGPTIHNRHLSMWVDYGGGGGGVAPTGTLFGPFGGPFRGVL